MYRLKKYLGNHYINYLSPFAVTSNHPVTLKSDSGASKTYIKPEHKSLLDNIQIIKNSLKATLPDKSVISISATGLLPLHEGLKVPSLVYTQLASKSPLSIGQLCDEDCLAPFDKNGLYIFIKIRNYSSKANTTSMIGCMMFLYLKRKK